MTIKGYEAAYVEAQGAIDAIHAAVDAGDTETVHSMVDEAAEQVNALLEIYLDDIKQCLDTVDTALAVEGPTKEE